MTDWDMLCIVRFYDELNFLNVWLNFFRCLEIHFRVEMTACPLPDVLDNLILSRMGYFTSEEFTRTGDFRTLSGELFLYFVNKCETRSRHVHTDANDCHPNVQYPDL